MKRYTMAAAAVSLALLGTTALAAPNIANTSQKGSLLVFPEIQAGGDAGELFDDRNTIIRMTNDNTGNIQVKCFYGEFTDQEAFDTVDSEKKLVTQGKKPTVDFEFTLTRNHSVFWEVKDGDGTKQMPDFPDESDVSDAGQLICWAVRDASDGQTQVKWNHLLGTATIIDPGDDTSFAYNAWSFFARGQKNKKQVGPVAGRLDLNGTGKDDGSYDKCGRYIIGQFGPVGSVTEGPENVHVDDLYLSVSSCYQCLVPVGHAKANEHWIVFTVWDDDENKRTGAKEKADGWWRMNLGSCDDASKCIDTTDAGYSEIDVNPQVFTQDILESDNGYFRAESFLNSAGTEPGYGLLGVLVHDLDDSGSGDYDINSVTTHHAGSRMGYIVWHPDAPVPEKK